MKKGKTGFVSLVQADCVLIKIEKYFLTNTFINYSPGTYYIPKLYSANPPNAVSAYSTGTVPYGPTHIEASYHRPPD
jgi:hypothetical protein